MSSSSNGVLAPMAGKVIEVKIAKGHQVKRDDTLVVIESMKTQMVIRSPQDGKIARVIYRQGVCLFCCLLAPPSSCLSWLAGPVDGMKIRKGC